MAHPADGVEGASDSSAQEAALSEIPERGECRGWRRTTEFAIMAGRAGQLEETMKIVKYVVVFVSFLAASPYRPAQLPNDSAACSSQYEDHNQIDYGPLKLATIRGGTTVGKEIQNGVPGACLVLFTEKEHKLVSITKADQNGRFELKDIAPGYYRLLARAEAFCVANMRIKVVKSLHRKAEILVHFQGGIDSCSYGELVPPTKTWSSSEH